MAYWLPSLLTTNMGCPWSIFGLDTAYSPQPGLVLGAIMDWWALRTEYLGFDLFQLPAYVQSLPCFCQNGHKAVHRMDHLQYSNGSHIVHSTGAYEACRVVDERCLCNHTHLHDDLHVKRCTRWRATA